MNASCPLSIRVVDPLRIAGWDEQVLQFADASVFHSAGWARVLHDAYGYRPLYLTASRGHELAGVLPLMEVDSWLTGKRGVSLPFSDFCPPLADGPEVADALVERGLELGRERKWKYIELRGMEAEHTTEVKGEHGKAESWNHGKNQNPFLLRPARSPAEPWQDPILHPASCIMDPASQAPHSASRIPHPASSHHLAHTVDLTRGLDALLASFTSSTRRAIRKAEKSGLEITVDSALGSLREFCRLNALTRRAHGLPPQPFSFFRSLHRRLLSQGHGFLVTARHRGRPVAASLFLHFGRHALFKYGASDARDRLLRPNNLVMWAGIQACRRHGATVLSLGRTDADHDGLRRFKTGWGAVEHDLLYHRLEPDTGARLTRPHAVSGRHNKLFRRLPIAANQFIGAALYPHLG